MLAVLSYTQDFLKVDNFVTGKVGRRGREVNTKAWEHNSVSHPDVTKGNFTSTKANSSSSETLAASVNQSLGIEAGACVKVIATSRRTR